MYSSDYINDSEQFILEKENFDSMINDLKQIYLSKNYLGLMSWLINRAFIITPNIKNNMKLMQSQIDFNKAILLKTLYNINSKMLINIFSKNN